MRFLDMLRAEFPEELPLIKDMPVFVADEIVRQLNALDVSMNETQPASAYGMVAPPFNRFFIEAKADVEGSLVRQGAYLFDVTGDEPEAIKKPLGTHWTMGLRGYLWAEGRFFRYDGIAFLHVARDGALLTDPSKTQIEVQGQAGRFVVGAEGVVVHVPYSLTTLSTLHKRCPIDLVSPTRQQRRKAQRAIGAKDITDYYLLKVRRNETPSTFESIGKPAKNSKRRAHIVRGHFRYYTEEAPLFGHTTGMVWTSQYDKGDDTVGKINKDYFIEADE